jgi:hypothetical protein
MQLEFSQQILEKNAQIPNFMKIRSVGAEFFHADGRTDMTMLNSRFSPLGERAQKHNTMSTVKNHQKYIVKLSADGIRS